MISITITKTAWWNPKIAIPKWKTRLWRQWKRDGGIVLYPQGSHHSSSQRIQVNSWSAKYDGSQEPQSWLSDYLQAVQILGGTKEIAMQSLQLHLTGAARSWLSKLEKETIRNWEDLTKQFTSNFRSTYKRPASIEEVKACVQQHDETLWAYIQR
jgi:hypothetical protein